MKLVDIINESATSVISEPLLKVQLERLAEKEHDAKGDSAKETVIEMRSAFVSRVFRFSREYVYQHLRYSLKHSSFEDFSKFCFRLRSLYDKLKITQLKPIIDIFRDMDGDKYFVLLKNADVLPATIYHSLAFGSSAFEIDKDFQWWVTSCQIYARQHHGTLKFKQTLADEVYSLLENPNYFSVCTSNHYFILERA